MRDPLTDPQAGDIVFAVMPTKELDKHSTGFMNVYRRVVARTNEVVLFRARGNAHTCHVNIWIAWCIKNKAMVQVVA